MFSIVKRERESWVHIYVNIKIDFKECLYIDMFIYRYIDRIVDELPKGVSYESQSNLFIQFNLPHPAYDR